MMLDDLKGRRVLVTGGSAGIGAAIAAPETHSAANKGKTSYQLIVIDLK